MPDEPETPTQNRAKVVRRRWWLIALVTLLLLGIGLLFSLQRTPVYQAQALLLLDSAQVATGDAGSAVQSEEVATQQMVVESRPVAQLVAKALGSTENQTTSSTPSPSRQSEPLEYSESRLQTAVRPKPQKSRTHSPVRT